MSPSPSYLPSQPTHSLQATNCFGRPSMSIGRVECRFCLISPKKKRLSAVEALQFQDYVARSLGTFPCKLFVQQCSVLFEQTLLWLDDGVSKSSPWGFAPPPPPTMGGWVCGALNGGIRDRIAYRTTIGDHRDQCNRSLEPSSWCRPCDFSCVSSVPSHHTMGLT